MLTIERITKDLIDDEVNFTENYIMVEKLGGGKQGVVLKVKNSVGKSFVLKLYSSKIIDENFFSDLAHLSKLEHKNIVSVITYGEAGIKTRKDKLKVTAKVIPVKPEDKENKNYYFYIMEYIRGKTLKELEKKKEYSPRLFELLVRQISKAIACCHENNITHKDIRSSSIIYGKNNESFKLVDFGLSREINESNSGSGSKKIDSKIIDIMMFSEVLEGLFKNIERPYSYFQKKGIMKSIHSAKSGTYSDINEFYNIIKQYFMVFAIWHFQPRIDQYLTEERFGRFDSKLRIPVSGSVLMCKEIKKIIDTPEFQRLRGVRQLGPTIFVFPGANHTRFEHSIGVYHLSLRYLDKLLSIPEFRAELEPEIGKNIKLIVLAALLHDIGHYPYSHWIEEMTLPYGLKIEKHENRARKILNTGKIKKVLTKTWKVDIEEIVKIINGEHEIKVLNSIISSAIDIDKVDYLARDSVHCGVSYGLGIDVDRLISSLHFDKENDIICLTKKGKSVLLSILATRNIMYQEIYWHKTVRANEAMFKRFFYKYVKSEYEYLKKKKNTKLTDSANEDLRHILNYTDDQFISTLHKWSIKNKKIQYLIKAFAFNRKGEYEPFYIFYNNQSKVGVEREFISKLFALNHHELYTISKKFVKRIKEIKKFATIKKNDIIFEVTPANANKEKLILDSFRFYNERREEFTDYSKDLIDLNIYLDNNQQAYIFCKKKYHKDLMDFIKEDYRFLEILSGL